MREVSRLARVLDSGKPECRRDVPYEQPRRADGVPYCGVVVEPDEDAWRAYVPDLESRGAATWGYTCEEALRNIQGVARMVIEELLDERAPLPDSVVVSPGTLVAVTV